MNKSQGNYNSYNRPFLFNFGKNAIKKANESFMKEGGFDINEPFFNKDNNKEVANEEQIILDDELSLSEVPKEQQSFFSIGEEFGLNGNNQNGNNQKIKKIRGKTFHLKMSSHIDYFHNLKYFIEGKKRYKYYFCYQDLQRNYYFQISYDTSKDVSLSQLKPHELLPHISDYVTFNRLIEIESPCLFDIKIGIEATFLSLGKGKPGRL